MRTGVHHAIKWRRKASPFNIEKTYLQLSWSEYRVRSHRVFAKGGPYVDCPPKTIKQSTGMDERFESDINAARKHIITQQHNRKSDRRAKKCTY